MVFATAAGLDDVRVHVVKLGRNGRELAQQYEGRET